MINLFWRLIAKVLARPAIADWLIAHAKLTRTSTSCPPTAPRCTWAYRGYSTRTDGRRISRLG